MKWFLLFLFALMVAPFSSAVITLSPSLNGTYVDSASDCSAESMYSILLHGDTIIGASVTDNVVSKFNISNPANITCSASYSDVAGDGSVDNTRRAVYDSVRNIYYSASFTDDLITVLNATADPVTYLMSSATDSASPGSLDQAYGVAVYRFSDTNVLMYVASEVDNEISVYNVTSQGSSFPFVAGFTNGTSGCSVQGARGLYFLGSSTHLAVLAYAGDSFTILNASSNGTLTCINTYTDSTRPFSVDGVSDMVFNNTTNIAYLLSEVDFEVTILNLTNVRSNTTVGNITLGGNTLGGIAYMDIGSQQFLSVGSLTAAQYTYFVNVTNPSDPELVTFINESSAACPAAITRKHAYKYPYLFAGSGTTTNACLITIKVFEEPPADTCTYSSGDWNIDAADNCVITSDVDVGGNNVVITGTGSLTVSTGGRIRNFARFVCSAVGYCRADEGRIG